MADGLGIKEGLAYVVPGVERLAYLVVVVDDPTALAALTSLRHGGSSRRFARGSLHPTQDERTRAPQRTPRCGSAVFASLGAVADALLTLRNMQETNATLFGYRLSRDLNMNRAG